MRATSWGYSFAINKLTLLNKRLFHHLYVSHFSDHTPYLPTMTEPHPDVTPVDFEIKLLSGQRLHATDPHGNGVVVGRVET